MNAAEIVPGPSPAPTTASPSSDELLARGAGFVHGDIKPDNIFLATDPEGWEVVKLIDFGTSRPSHPRAKTDSGVRPLVYGTPPYMAPEQRRGYTALPAGDVYSLGVVLREALPDRDPRDEGIPGGWTLAIAEPLRELVTRMMSPEPSVRPALDEIAEALAARAGEARHIAARPTPIARLAPLPAAPVALALPEDEATMPGRVERPVWLRLPVAIPAVALAIVIIAVAYTWTRIDAPPAARATRPAAIAAPAVSAVPVVSVDAGVAPAPVVSATPDDAPDAAPAVPVMEPAEPVTAPTPPMPAPARRPATETTLANDSPPEPVPDRETGDGTIDPFE